MRRFRLRFPGARIQHWASRFSDSGEDDLESEIAPRIQRRGFLTRADFLRLCRWKTPRSRPHVERNPEGFIRAVTATALSTPDERLRIEVLTLLDGVDWPTASVILHFGHRDRYPILDVRALWTLGIEKPPAYNYDFWWGFTRACRRLAEKHACTMRTLDRALWQYSKERQGLGQRNSRPKRRAGPREVRT
jgi:hypothetical protein